MHALKVSDRQNIYTLIKSYNSPSLLLLTLAFINTLQECIHGQAHTKLNTMHAE